MSDVSCFSIAQNDEADRHTALAIIQYLRLIIIDYFVQVQSLTLLDSVLYWYVAIVNSTEHFHDSFSFSTRMSGVSM